MSVFEIEVAAKITKYPKEQSSWKPRVFATKFEVNFLWQRSSNAGSHGNTHTHTCTVRGSLTASAVKSVEQQTDTIRSTARGRLYRSSWFAHTHTHTHFSVSLLSRAQDTIYIRTRARELWRGRYKPREKAANTETKTNTPTSRSGGACEPSIYVCVCVCASKSFVEEEVQDVKLASPQPEVPTLCRRLLWSLSVPLG